MRRTDREVTECTEICAILNKCKICRLAMVDDGQPYMIPLCYAYEMLDDHLTLFFHSATAGRKLDILAKNPGICFEISTEGEAIFNRDAPCNSGYGFASVHGFGQVQLIQEPSEKCRSLTLLMAHQVNAQITFTPEEAQSVWVYKVMVASFTGKSKHS